MSKITTIHDGIIAKLAAVYTAKTRIPNAYSPPDNPDAHKKNGYGVKFNGSERAPFNLCQRRVSATFSVVFTRQLLKLDKDQAAFDVVEKALLEDAETFQSSFYAHDHIDVPDIIAIDVTNISGIQNLDGDKYKLVTIECEMRISYYEQIN